MSNTGRFYPIDELKRAVTAAARPRSISEAEVIRQAVADAVADDEPPRHAALFASDALMADDVDTHLAGFGER